MGTTAGIRVAAGAGGGVMEAAGTGGAGVLAGVGTDAAKREFRSMAFPSRAIVESARDLVVGVDLVIENGCAARWQGAMMAWC
jgi:hypothetical protein